MEANRIGGTWVEDFSKSLGLRADWARPVVTAPFLPEKKGSAAEMLETLEATGAVRERTSTSATSPEPRRFAWDHGPPDRRASRIGQRDSRVVQDELMDSPASKKQARSGTSGTPRRKKGRRGADKGPRRLWDLALPQTPWDIAEGLMASTWKISRFFGSQISRGRGRAELRGSDRIRSDRSPRDETAARAWEKLKSLASLCPAPESCVETALVVKDRIEVGPAGGEAWAEAEQGLSRRLHHQHRRATSLRFETRKAWSRGAGRKDQLRSTGAICIGMFCGRVIPTRLAVTPAATGCDSCDFGQLGDNQARSSHTPVRVQGLGPSLVVTAGGLHSCAVEVSGRAKCWGKGEDGQLGFGGRSRRHDARPVAQLGVALDVRAGGSHTCALEAGGAVRCWGWGEFGQLGNGRTRDSLYPLRVQHLDSAIAICSGGLHSCAVETGGSVKCWGWGERGQLGSFNGTQRSSSPFPVEIEGIEDAIDVACGYQHSCAMSQNTTVCWGDGIDRQLQRHDEIWAKTTRRIMRLNEILELTAPMPTEPMKSVW
ncbi:Ultraviolet-B receptor UVR8 (Protein UV-B RESISTANCE 8) (RCC1 domain-containing protein UVR8) [Durusdinium trenchii]|uniref:Ultraviolet-B receptor UVR8 (Protein UV-B RESISTANCE 8) (RCC1 domain-containing protein UVR8) n=1 Tax=Durusdinium trenchii TaxID=1381693 RepID=A0ABP0LX68_9DINO